jgi:DNA-binding MarR family transcriptional regulator
VRAVGDESPFRYAEADDSPGFLLWKITALWQQTLAGVLGHFGITQTQHAILASLRWFEERRKPATQADLAEHAKLEKMTLSKAIRRLEGDGLVKRAQSSSDGRATQVRSGDRQARRSLTVGTLDQLSDPSSRATRQRPALGGAPTRPTRHRRS